MFVCVYIYIYICVCVCVCICVCVCVHLYWSIGLISKVFANGLGDWSSILGRVIPKTQKMVLETTLLNTQHYKVWVKWSNPGKGVVPSSTPRCSSYRKGSLLVTLD